jgi:hypothetical protein
MILPNSHIFYRIRQPETEPGIVTKIVSGVPLTVNLSKALNMVTFGIGKMVTHGNCSAYSDGENWQKV